MKRRRKRQAAISLKKELPLDPLQVSNGSKSGGDDKLKLRMNFRFRIRNKGGKGEERKKEHLQPQPKVCRHVVQTCKAKGLFFSKFLFFCF